MSDDNCLDASSPEGPVKLVRCHGMGGNQAWTYNTQVIFLLLHLSEVKDDGCVGPDIWMCGFYTTP
jgi:hypothetical protein